MLRAMQVPEITLRYFDARGRAQAIREFLSDAGIPFQDERVPLSGGALGWPSVRERPELAGPFKALPVLHWGDAQIAETLVIASFLARHVPPSRGLDELALSRLDMICSAAFFDVFYPVAEIIWSSTAFPGCEPETAVRIHGPRALAKLRCIDARAGEVRFFGGAQPALADFFAAEALAALSRIVPKPERLADHLPALSALTRRLSERSGASGTAPARPTRLTGCPIEPEVLDRLSHVDWLA